MTSITRETAGGRQITAELGVGLVLGFMLVAFMLSFASLLFNGAPQFVGAGAGLFLVGAAVHNLGSARWSAGAGAIVVPQDAPTAIVAAALASLLPAVEAAQRAGTILVYTAVCTLAAGVVMVALGAARLGRLARYIPTPVIGGFLAGTGWLLVSGGAELVTAGYRLDALHVAALAATVALAVALLLTLRFKPSVLVVPAMVAAGTVLFFAVLAVTGTSLEQARSLGLLPSTPAAALRLPFMEMATADLSMLSSGLGGIISVPLVSTMALLLNVSALDLLRGEDGDLDGELRNVGFTNLIIATVGLPAGYHAIGPTALAYRLGVVSWRVPLVVAVVALAAAFAGSVLVGLVPIPVISGLLIFLGLGFMTDWLIDRRRRMSVSEFAVMLTIVAIVATLGLLAAVAWGMVAAVVLFVVAYSRIDPIRYVGTARERRSTVDREAAASDFLDEEGGAILVIELHGYLFFGTSHALIDRIQGMLAHPRRTLILDLHRVEGADSTALSSFAKLARVTGGSSCRLILSEVPSRLRTGLQEELAGYDCRMLPDLDHALEVAEDLLLEDLEQAGPTCRDVFGPHLWSRLEPHLERREAEVGEVIIEHGDNEVALLAIEGGQVVTEIPAGGGWRRVRISGAGTVVGEMSLYRPGGRSARVRVAAPTVLYRLGGRAVAELERSEPETAAELHRVLARLMAERVALSNEAIRSLLA